MSVFRRKILFLMIQDGRAILWVDGTKDRYVLSNDIPLGHYLADGTRYLCHILLDTPPQDFLCKPVPKLSYLDRLRFVRTHLICRFGDRFIGRGKFNAKNRTLNGWRLTHDDQIQPWLKILKHHPITVQSIASVPQEWGHHSPLMQSDPTLVLTLDEQSILRHWYYENNQCLFSRITILTGDVMGGAVWQDKMNRELHLSLAYLEGRGLKSQNVHIVVQVTPPYRDSLLGIIQNIPLKSLQTVPLDTTFDQYVTGVLSRPRVYRLPFYPTASINQRRQKKKTTERGVLGLFILLLFLCVLAELKSLVGTGIDVAHAWADHRKIHHAVSQMQTVVEGLDRNPLPPVAHWLGRLHLSNGCFWRDRGRFEQFLKRNPHRPHRLTDFVWTYDDDTRTLRYDVGIVSTVFGHHDELKTQLQRSFPNFHVGVEGEQVGHFSAGFQGGAERNGPLPTPAHHWTARLWTTDMSAPPPTTTAVKDRI